MKSEDFHLRFFLTPKCNFRCIYCNESGTYLKKPLITTKTIKGIIKAAQKIGINKIHYTGGEPSLRKDLIEIVSFAKKCNFKEQVITTNGSLSEKTLIKLKKSGLSRINISLDTFNKKKFEKITNNDSFNKVLGCIKTSLKLFKIVKLNIVMISLNSDEFCDILEFSRKSSGKLIPKFIELVPNNPSFYKNKEYLNKIRVSRSEFFNKIKKLGKIIRTDVKKENPNCEYYKIKDTPVTFGLITMDSKSYPCGDCKKIRISPYGEIGYCITSEKIQINENDDHYRILSNVLRKRELLNKNKPLRKHLSSNYGHWRFGNLKQVFR